jgi:cell division protein FtsB
MRAWGRSAQLVLAGLALAVLLLFVLPTRTYLAQQRDLRQMHADVEALEQANRDLAEQSKRLESPAEIERLARERYNMVRPGERAFAVVPPPGATTTTTG